jgi:hypothetical protein
VNIAVQAVRDYCADAVEGWNRFWFTPTDPAVLSAIRVCAGAMLLYTHFMWSFDLNTFFGASGILPNSLIAAEHQGRAAFTFFLSIESPWLLWTVHLAALVVFAMFAAGLFTRVVSVLAWMLAVQYALRVDPGAFFGLDKINVLLATYLMLGPCGAYYSVDRWLARRRADGKLPPPEPSVSANIAIRLIQLHMCIVYLFSGLGKLQGWSWWDGTAMWQAVANVEYRSLDLTWLARWPKLTALLTHITVFWELFYVALIWPKKWRPIVLLSAVVVHGGIALAMGMITFGLAMLIGNIAFLSPQFVRAVVDSVVSRARNRGTA